MPGAVFVPNRPFEYSMLNNVEPIGPSMGFYAGREIPAFVVDEFGRRFAYAGVAPRKWNGVFDADALSAGEFIVRPGLIYRLERSQSLMAGWARAA
jgi:hypothetical protein